MRRAPVNGVELEYEVRGTGEPVLLVHGSHIGGSFVPLMAQRVLTDRYTLIRYHRRGFLGSSPAIPPVSIAQQADDCRALLEHLEVGPAHVVGHSYGGPIALQLAAGRPAAVASLALLEAALLDVAGGDDVRRLVARAARLYGKGEWEAAEDLFLGSPKERADIERTVPGGLDQALRDVDTYFAVEAPAHDEWEFGEAEAARVRCPTLFVMGAESSQLYRNACAQVREWMPQTEEAEVADASHLLQIQQPAVVARRLADFLDAHPSGEPSAGGRGRRPAAPRPAWSPERYNATADLLDGRLEAGRAGKVAIRGPDDDWTYGDLAAGASRAGAALRSLGVQIENRVLLAMVDSPQMAAAFFGAIKLGAVPVPVNTNLTADEYVFLLVDSRARVAVVSASVAEVVRQARGRAPHLEHVVVVGEPGPGPGEPGPGEHGWEDITRSAPDELTAADTTADDVGFWLYTSGTGGRPKGVIHTQRAMRSCVDTYARTVLDLSEDDTTFSISKLYFAYGLGGGLYFPLAAGATTVLSPEPPQPRMILDTLRQYRPTVLFGVPTSYSSILNAGRSRWKGDEFDSLRACVSAGEPLAASLLRRWREETGLDIVEGAGSTESCHIVVSNRIGEVRPGRTGAVVEGYRVRLVGEDGRDVPEGQPGRLLVAGESVFMGYWRQRAQTAATLGGEWLDTGDVYVGDDEGWLAFQGRLDDMVKVSGMWVSPVEVEETLGESELVADCAVVGVHDAINLVRLVAFVVPTGDQAPDEVERELRQVVRRRLGSNKTPRAFRLVDHLPRASTGKLQRSALREQARAVINQVAPDNADQPS